ncbi:MAG: D-alanyl-D-alanine carboxypeptidase [Flavobacteriaceae bacterium]|nr:D-alanyl-D-alanine carboxypeptidase [Flavobacteriaceae bacterium]|tara:strand:- start:143812 stop:144552 length:741 start_codon:yes stop_codon:yes gene_type:complete
MRLLVLLILFLNLLVQNQSSDSILDGQMTNRQQIDSIPTISKNFLLGKFDYRKDDRFIKVDAKFCSKEIWLQKKVYEAYVKMYVAAIKEGIELKILSGTRNFYEQKWIWERKWKSYSNLKPKDRAIKILEYSSMPSTSRHHWGTDLDLVSLSPKFFKSTKGQKVHNWIQNNANRYGFYQVYTSDPNRKGYQEEPWHWTYLPLSQAYLQAYNKEVDYGDFKGFQGSRLAKELKVIDHFVNGVNKRIQ